MLNCGDILTISDRIKSPLVVPEEWVSLDFLHAVPAQSHLPQNKESDWVVEQWLNQPFVHTSVVSVASGKQSD